ncbi:MAG: MarR family winged helix-turn-helix transcriptional regulator [Vicinamibacterales bacterium]
MTKRATRKSPPTPDSLPTRITTGLVMLARALKSQGWHAADAQGLSTTQRDIVMLLAADGTGGRRLSEVAAQLSITSATASDAVRVLHLKGLVRKGRSGADGRHLALTLTAAGRRRAGGLAAWPSFLGEATSALSQSERSTFLRAIVVLLAELQERGVMPSARMCVTCEHFRPHASGLIVRPHLCAFVNASFADAGLRVDCPDHRGAERAVARKNWAAFRRDAR